MLPRVSDDTFQLDSDDKWPTNQENYRASHQENKIQGGEKEEKISKEIRRRPTAKEFSVKILRQGPEQKEKNLFLTKKRVNRKE